MTRLQWKQKKYAVASSQYDKLLRLMEDRHGEDSKLLIPVYQECGKISFCVMAFFGGRGMGWGVWEGGMKRREPRGMIKCSKISFCVMTFFGWGGGGCWGGE